MLEGLEEQQQELENKLKEKKIESSSPDGEIKVTLNAGLEIENISLDLSKIDVSTPDQLEDLLIVTLNQALDEAKIKQAAESQKLLANMMPGGFGDLSKLLAVSIVYIHLDNSTFEQVFPSFHTYCPWLFTQPGSQLGCILFF